MPQSQPSTRPPLYKGYRFPPEVISYYVWLYCRGMSLRDVSELMLARGIEVSHEASASGRCGSAQSTPDD
jgi:transposase-like protein